MIAECYGYPVAVYGYFPKAGLAVERPVSPWKAILAVRDVKKAGITWNQVVALPPSMDFELSL